ncbi:ester cyclase [Microvirga tunisiensis]|uniref:Ester cyclase n=1 Tax=Microvirga tunisiensis TaxID=2108360 RepID=A0A5N7MW85_9HYPH|nr:ester cyclase [Microvirga tunisiensis]MPR13301.1 ester cyclase [Microvirga tunisiensis]MPR31168.1 ester cyclase [Microvirga tunisiensis]
MTSDSEYNKALVRAHYEATANHFDPPAIDDQVGEDFFDHAAGARLGPEGVKRHIQGMKVVFPDLRVTIEDIIAEGDRVAVRARWQGTHSADFRGIPASHERIEFTGMVFWRIADGKIRERWASVDLLGPLKEAAEV